MKSKGCLLQTRKVESFSALIMLSILTIKALLSHHILPTSGDSTYLTKKNHLPIHVAHASCLLIRARTNSISAENLQSGNRCTSIVLSSDFYRLQGIYPSTKPVCEDEIGSVYLHPLSDSRASNRIRSLSKDAYALDTRTFQKPFLKHREDPSKSMHDRLKSRL